MPTLHIRIQPDLSPDLDLAAVLALFSSAAEVVDAELEILGTNDDDDDDGDDGEAGEARFVSFDFRTLDVARLWTVLQGQVFWDDAVGPALAEAAIVTCDGRHSGDSGILLLHHHDRTIVPDTLDDA
jgi:hypothetical protein